MRRSDREVKDIEGIEEILLLCKTCHVAMVDDGEPYVVPLSYGYRFVGGAMELYFHSAAEGRKLDVLKRSNSVCFEISYEGEPICSENPCKSGCHFASVIGLGKASFIENEKEKCEALSMLYKRQSGMDVTFNAGQAQSVCVFKITSTKFTGKKH